MQYKIKTFFYLIFCLASKLVANEDVITIKNTTNRSQKIKYLIKSKNCGICTSDFHWKSAFVAPYKTKVINCFISSLRHSLFKSSVSFMIEPNQKILYLMEKAKNNNELLFSLYYHNNYWGSKETKSGTGSEVKITSPIQQKLPNLLRKIKAESILDAPCGDFNWMKEVKLSGKKYIGIDIVQELIFTNQSKYADKSKEFKCLDIISDQLPQVDIIICRDCLVHFPFKEIKKTLDNFKKSRSKYLLIERSPKTDNLVNTEIPLGSWRPLNFFLPPFNLPSPIDYIQETEESGYKDKCLALWRLNDIVL